MGIENVAVGDHTDDISDEHRVRAEVDLLEQHAFQGIGKFFDERGVDQQALFRGESGFAEFVAFPSRDHTDKVGLLEVLFGGDIHREGPGLLDVVKTQRRLPERHADTGRFAGRDSSPGGRHDIRPAIGAVGSDDEHRRGEQDRLRGKGKLHGDVLSKKLRLINMNSRFSGK